MTWAETTYTTTSGHGKFEEVAGTVWSSISHRRRYGSIRYGRGDWRLRSQRMDGHICHYTFAQDHYALYHNAGNHTFLVASDETVTRFRARLRVSRLGNVFCRPLIMMVGWICSPRMAMFILKSTKPKTEWKGLRSVS